MIYIWNTSVLFYQTIGTGVASLCNCVVYSTAPMVVNGVAEGFCHSITNGNIGTNYYIGHAKDATKTLLSLTKIW